VLVSLAREAIAERLGIGRVIAREEAWLAQPAATFVTLRDAGELRGCIGSLDARRPLGVDVTSNARAAAFSDPRFEPVVAAEYVRLSVEVSVLSPRTPFEVADEEDAARRLCAGVDGVYLEYRGLSATFLPQVWESLPDPLDFLAALKHKAGLPPRFWDPAIRLSRYTVRKHADERAR
jgi:AmmeMemoRadiSam system protein A